MKGKASTGPHCLVIGLGNPGKRYESSRHNAGFRVVERLALQSKALFSAHARIPALVADWKTKGFQWIALKPVTFMNLSGQAVAAALNFWKFELSSLMIVLDDVELKPGELRLRKQGGTGGHQGLNSIIEHLHTRQFARLRIGIGRPSAPDIDLSKWVLESFEKTELPRLEDSIRKAVGAIETWVAAGLDVAMNRYNRQTAPKPKDVHPDSRRKTNIL